MFNFSFEVGQKFISKKKEKNDGVYTFLAFGVESSHLMDFDIKQTNQCVGSSKETVLALQFHSLYISADVGNICQIKFIIIRV